MATSMEDPPPSEHGEISIRLNTACEQVMDYSRVVVNNQATPL
jgi:hypothetical protein